jgi:hypothetical protein
MDTMTSSHTHSAYDDDPRVREAVRFMQDVALGRRSATTREVNRACEQLDRYLPDFAPEET